MPDNAPYAWETDEQFRQRIQQQQGIRPPLLSAAGPRPPQPQSSPGILNTPPSVQSQASTGQLPPLSEEAATAIAAMPGQELELDAMGQQLAQAQALRDTAMPEGRGYGGVYTAANPLEFIGAGIKQYKGAKREKELDEKMGETRGKLGESAGTYHVEAARRGGLDILKRKKKDGSED